jgi:hypothetical protein
VVAGGAVPSSTAADRLAGGPAFAAADIITASPEALSAPAFNASAGVFGAGDVQPALPPPQHLGSRFTLMPVMQEALPSSVAAIDPFADESVGPGLPALSRAAIAFSADGTVARPRLGDAAWISGAPGPGDAADAVLAGRLTALTRSSVFVDPGARPAAAPSAQAALSWSAMPQDASALTAYEALRDRPNDPAASPSAEAFVIATPAVGATSVVVLRLPLKVITSYGFLSSSLAVFSDDFGSFSGIGQSFDGLMALNMAEPAALAMVVVSLAGLAALRWRRQRN